MQPGPAWLEIEIARDGAEVRASARAGGVAGQPATHLLGPELEPRALLAFADDVRRAADPYLFMLVRWTRAMTRPARELPNLSRHAERMLSREAIREPFKVEGSRRRSSDLWHDRGFYVDSL